MSVDTLFALPSDAIKVTSDDCYTPRWVFDAMGLEFDLDAAAPPGGPWHVPAKRWYTAEDDGLTSPWEGLVWCNPPYSNFWPWVEKWSTHPTGVLMGSWMKARWCRAVTEAADAIAFLGAVKFSRPEGDEIELRQHVFVAFRGVGDAPAVRLAAGDPRAAVLYGRP